jgi:hypothetical protein
VSPHTQPPPPRSHQHARAQERTLHLGGHRRVPPPPLGGRRRRRNSLPRRDTLGAPRPLPPPPWECLRGLHCWWCTRLRCCCCCEYATTRASPAACSSVRYLRCLSPSAARPGVPCQPTLCGEIRRDRPTAQFAPHDQAHMIKRGATVSAAQCGAGVTGGDIPQVDVTVWELGREARAAMGVSQSHTWLRRE